MKKRNKKVDTLVMIKLAETLLTRNEYKKAKTLLEKVIDLDKRNPEAYYLLGEALCKEELFQEAVTSLKIANTLLPNHPRILHLLGWSTFMYGDANLGRKYMKMALEKIPDDIQILCDLTALENKEGKHEEAMEYIQKAMSIDPRNPMVQELFHVTSLMNKLHDEVITRVN